MSKIKVHSATEEEEKIRLWPDLLNFLKVNQTSVFTKSLKVNADGYYY